ncbi:MAG TPA: NFACT RNA binding domain-containing protein, partial [Haploplasma sp.]|nr:NFACT RNA binding domain-containing protein [Haploplasma sp.]
YNDAIFYVGKNNLQNEYVTHEIGKHNDFWFHIKDAPGSHIVLKGELNDLNLSFGAMLAAKFSKQSDTPVVSVNFTQIKNIKKIPGLKGYNVILTKFETINIRIDHELLSNYLLHTI